MTPGTSRAPSNDSAPRPVRRRWAAAFAVWVAFIWGNSLIQGSQSSLESGMVVALVRPLFEAVGVMDADLMTLVVRKLAHFSEYAVLGVIARGLFRSLWRERGVAPFPRAFAVALVPVADECLQLFVPGRMGQPTDVLIDLAGLITGALAAWLVAWVRRRLSL